jgi:hypothetical protein
MTANFKSYNSKEHNGGIAYKHFYPNGYGVSIIKNRYSYGGDEGKWELAVLEGNEVDWQLCYTTPITEDVLGWLEEDEVDEICKQVMELPNAIK